MHFVRCWSAAAVAAAAMLLPVRAWAEELVLPDTLVLQELERLVLERNPAVARARAGVQKARARARQAGALDDPMLDLMVAPRSLGSRTVDPGYRVGVMQRLPLFGQRGLRRRGAEAEAEAAGADEIATRLDLVQQTREAYFVYYRAARGLETNALVSDLMDRFRRIALAKYGAGTVGQHEPLQAEVEIAMLDHDRQVLERQRRVAIARLNTLLLRDASAPLPPPVSLLEAELPPMNADSLRGEARGLRPELSAARSRVSARRAELALARRNRLPETTFGAAYDRFWMEAELQPTISVQLNLPIHFGRLRAGEVEASAGVAMAEAELALLEAEIGREVEERVAELDEARHELRIVRESLLPASERALIAARASYEANRADFQALLNASRELARVHLLLHDLLAQTGERSAALDRAIGFEEAGR